MFIWRLLSCLCSVSLILSVFANQDVEPWTNCKAGKGISGESGGFIPMVSWDLGSSAISFKNSHWHDCQRAEALTARFIQQNYSLILEQTVKGGGEHVITMMDMLDINGYQSDKILQGVQEDIMKLVLSPEYINAPVLERANMYYRSLIRRARQYGGHFE